MGNSKSHEKRGCSVFGYRDISEEHTNVSMNIIGTLPSWLSGTLYAHRAGAYVGPYQETHVFDGLAHVFSWRFTMASVQFSNKFINSCQYQRWKKTGERVWQGTAVAVADPEPRDEAEAAVRYNFNVSFWRHAMGIGAASEFPGGAIAMLKDNLDTAGEIVLFPEGTDIFSSYGICATGAHYWESDTTHRSDIHVAWYIKMKRNRCVPVCEAGYRVMRIDMTKHGSGDFARPARKPTMSAVTEHTDFPVAAFSVLNAKSVPRSKRISFVHSFGITAHFVVVPISSKRMEYNKMLTRDFSRGFFGLYTYEILSPVEFHVFDATTLRHITTCTAQHHGLLFHVVNTVEQDGRLMIDVGYLNGEVVESMGLPMATESDVRRYTLDLQSGSAHCITLTSHIKDFATYSPFAWGKPTCRFLYGMDLPLGPSKDGSIEEGSMAIWKEDVSGVAAPSRWQIGDIMVGTEPQFVPRYGGDEDDGVVLVPASRPSDETSWLIVLDAKTMMEIARMECPVTVNAGLHNLFVPDGVNDYPLRC